MKLTVLFATATALVMLVRRPHQKAIAWGDRDLWKQLTESREWVQVYHNALWEEERHYAWWVSIILPALAVVYAAPGVPSDAKRVIIFAGALIGLVLSLLAQHVVHLEGNNFTKAMWRHEAAARALRLNALRDVPDLGRVRLYDPGFRDCQDERSAMQAGNSVIRRGKRDGIARIGIRSSFRLTFMLFMAAYTAILVLIWIYPPPFVAK